MVAPAQIFIAGTGLYSVREAALYARLHPTVLRRWLFGNSSGERVLHPQIEQPGEKVVTFLDFVQALAVRAIRTQHQIALDKVRTAIEVAEQEFQVKWPLARRHTIYLLGRDIQIVPELNGDPVQVTGPAKGQVSLRSVVELHLRDLGWDAEGLARHYRPFLWGDREISMNPEEHFGEPVVPSCRYSARVLWEAAETEGGIEPAAAAYGVQEEEVEVACRYFDHLQGAAA